MPDLIDAKDLEFTCMTPQPGGQHVGVYSGVTVTHKPTGIVISVDVARSQHRNRQVAMDALAGALTSPHLK